MLKRLTLLVGLVILLAVPRPAFAVLGMCTVTGTVYNVDGSVAKNGVVNFRLPSTQTFSADSVQTSLEHVVLDNGGNLPVGTQVPLGARIFIQVGSDKPVSVVVTNNPANCPLAFGTLVGSGAGGVPIPSTVVTSISTINNIPGITDTAVNPPGAGPATLTLSDGYPITFGSSSSAADLSGTGAAPLFTQVGGATNGTILQDETSATGSHLDGQLVFGGTNSPDTDKRDVVMSFLTPGNNTHSNGHFQLFVADNSGTMPGAILDVLPATSTFNYSSNGATEVAVENTNAGASAQAKFSVENINGDQGDFGQTGASSSFGAPFLANQTYIDAVSTNGLLEYSLGGPIHFAASGQGSHGTADLTEDVSADFALTIPALFAFVHNFNGGLGVQASNSTSGTGAQSYFQAVSNPGTTFFGTRSTGWTAGDIPANYGFVESDGNTSGLYLVSDAATGDEGIHFAANSQLAAGNLKMTEDASADFFLTMPNVVQFLNNTNSAAQVAVSNNNAGGNAQAEFEVENGNGLIGNFSATGASSTFGAPYTANMTYIQGLSSAGLLVNAAGGAIHLGASGQAGVGTLDITEDGSNNFFFEPTNTTGLVRFTGGNNSQPVMQLISTVNNTNDILSVFPQNLTQEVGIWYGGIREEGSGGNNSLNLDPQGTGAINLNGNTGGSGAWAFSSLGTVNNHHTFSALNSGTQPSISSCGGTATAAMRAGSTDVAGEVDITVGGTISPNCLINFGAAWGANPICNCNVWNGSSVAITCATNTSTTQMNLWTQASINAGGHITWQCTGLVNGASG